MMFAETFEMPNVPLRELDLSVNYIHDAGGELIAKSLARCPYLTSLNLRRNNLKDTTAIILIKSLQTNTALMNLNLERNVISPSFKEEIETIIEANRN